MSIAGIDVPKSFLSVTIQHFPKIHMRSLSIGRFFSVCVFVVSFCFGFTQVCTPMGNPWPLEGDTATEPPRGASDPGSWTTDPEPGSGIQDPRYQHPGSWLMVLGSQGQGPGSSFLAGPWIQGPVSRTLDPGNWHGAHDKKSISCGANQFRLIWNPGAT